MVKIEKKHSKKFILFSLLIIFIIGIAGVALKVSQQENIKQSMLAKEWGEKLPRNVKITDQTATSFTVSWTTEVPTYGIVKLSSNPNGRLIYVANVKPLNEHKVTVDNLLPYSPYTFTVNSDNFTYGRSTKDMLVSLGLYGDIKAQDSFRTETLPLDLPDQKPSMTYQEYLQMHQDKLDKPIHMESAVFKDGNLNSKFIPMTTGGTEKNNLFVLGEAEDRLLSPIVIVIEQSLISLVDQGDQVLRRYISEQFGEGHDVVVWTYDGYQPDKFPDILREKFRKFYEAQGGIHYALFIGDIPPEWAAPETNSRLDHEYTTDIFYMDPYSKCVDANGDGLCEKREAGSGGFHILFPVTRLPRPAKDTREAISLINNYFQKYFEYKRNFPTTKKTFHFSNWSLSGYTEGNEKKIQQTLERILPDESYIRKETYKIQPPEKAIDYVRNIWKTASPFLFTIISTHSGPQVYAFYAPPPESPDTVRYLDTYTLKGDGVKSYFFDNTGCSTGVYLDKDVYPLGYTSMTQIYNLPITVGAIGTATLNTPFTPAPDIAFFETLSKGSSLVDALLALYNQNNPLCREGQDKNNGMRECFSHVVYFGIPTMKTSLTSNYATGCEARKGWCVDKNDSILQKPDITVLTGEYDSNYGCTETEYCIKYKDGSSGRGRPTVPSATPTVTLTPTKTPVKTPTPVAVSASSCSCEGGTCSAGCTNHGDDCFANPDSACYVSSAPASLPPEEPPAQQPQSPQAPSTPSSYSYPSTGARCTYGISYQHGFCTPTGDLNLWLYCNDGGFAQTPKNSSICPFPGRTGISCIGNGFKIVDADFDCCNGQPTVNGVCGGGGTSSYTPPPPPAQPPPASSGCGATCTYSQQDTDGVVRCYQGNCTSTDCGLNKNCSWISGCSSGAVVNCP